MKHVTPVLSTRQRRALLLPGITLAFQGMRPMWRMLCLVALGMLASVMVMCTVPLYSRVALTADLRATLASHSQSNDIVVRGESTEVTSQDIHQFTQSLDQEFHQNLGSYLLPGQFSLQAPPLFIEPPPGFVGPLLDQVGMIGVDTARAAPHLKFVRGHMPASVVSGNTIEIAIRADEAATLSWDIGTVIPVTRMNFWSLEATKRAFSVIRVRVVGIFNLINSADPFWHGEDFAGRPEEDANFFTAYSLVSNTALISLMSPTFVPDAGRSASPYELIWYYSLDTSQIQIDDVNPILRGIRTVQADNANNHLLNTLKFVHTYLPSDALTLYQQHLPIVQFPVTSLTALALCLLFFLMTLTVGILVDHPTGTFGLLRSRGATRGQIFWSLVMQAVLLGLIALVAGPLLAVFLTHALAQHMLPGAAQGALNVVDGNPLPIALSVALFALVTACVMVAGMILAMWGTVSREIAR